MIKGIGKECGIIGNLMSRKKGKMMARGGSIIFIPINISSSP